MATDDKRTDDCFKLTFDEDEMKLLRKMISSISKGSSIDCVMDSDDLGKVEIDTGHQVFHVNKVSERENGHRIQSGQDVVRVHKGFLMQHAVCEQ